MISRGSKVQAILISERIRPSMPLSTGVRYEGCPLALQSL